jgi:hypothetical protein
MSQRPIMIRGGGVRSANGLVEARIVIEGLTAEECTRIMMLLHEPVASAVHVVTGHRIPPNLKNVQ